MKELREEIETIVKELDSIVEMFYQQKTQEAYTKLNPVLENIMKMAELIQKYYAELDMEELLNALKEALSAMEERDAILMADVLKYEVIEKLNDIAAHI